MIPKSLLYDGSNQPAPEPLVLVAGPLTMQFEPLTGFLRYIRLGDHEVVRAIYAAVRDHNWGTVPPHLTNLTQEIKKDSFQLGFDVQCRQDGIDYFWHGTIVGEADGMVRYAFDGEARSDFQRNRIGLCVLHPITECAGQPCTIQHSDGRQETGVFPKFIAPWQPFYDVRKIAYQVAGVDARLAFEGDEFEMEDQRNWSDASFKTYCTPQKRPKPVAVGTGDKVRQAVTVGLEPPLRPVLPVLVGRPPQFSISTTPVLQLPPIGFCVERSGTVPDALQIERLRKLAPAHLRVDLRLSSADYADCLKAAVAQSQALKTPLHIALILSNDGERELKSLAGQLKTIKPPVGLWLVFHEQEESVDERWVKAARQALHDYAPEAFFAAGTLQFFTELNRHRPTVDTSAFPCFSLNPQVHAFDNATMVENLSGQMMDVESAREFSPRPVVVSPITLRIRGQNDADARQRSLFGAGWTLGSIARLTMTGHIHSLTYFETIGARGLMGDASASPGSDGSSPGGPVVFPMYHLFADVAEFPGKQIYPTHSSHPLITEGLTLVDAKKRRRILVANLGSHPQEVKIKTGTCQATIRYLDETNAERAMTQPEQFRTDPGEKSESISTKIQLMLRPYALARVDID